MKKILVIVMLIFAFGCSDDATEPSENTIVGAWMKQMDSEDVDIPDVLIMEFTEEGKYNAIGVDKDNKRDTLVGSYTLNNNRISFSDEKCDDTKGIYDLVFKDNGVEFVLVDDECDRSNFITGFFDKYKATLYNK